MGVVKETEVLVIGGGPGGYAAAFRAADLGVEVTMISAEPRPGGECLFRGCIPSKTLLSLTELMHEADLAGSMGVDFGKPRIDLEALRAWKGKVTDKLADGLVRLSKKRGVRIVHARAVLEGSDRVRLLDSEISHLKFNHAILATGSQSIPLAGMEFKPGGLIVDSAGALELVCIPETLLVIGGGYVGLELGSVYAALGSRVSVLVRSDRLLRGADIDLVTRLQRRLVEMFEAIHFNATIKSLEAREKKVDVVLDGEVDHPEQVFDQVLIAIGRRPNTENLGLETTKVTINEQGFVIVDEQRRTADDRIFAVGDLVGHPMLAHKAMFEGRVAAEAIAGKASVFDPQAIPAVVYTDPQLAWCGLTEEQANEQGRSVRVTRFPWKFSGRAITMDAPEGLTKMIIDSDSGRVLGVGIVGRDAEGLITEGVLAIEMGAMAEDVALTIHPHPTLAETAGEAAELFLGSATHILSQSE
ncbi:MAG: dihydrolipoyl dehydrogenase [Proteobacteria bacterium]|nr:dihydrolipoyl dehydrogenase [Pseudomonadota bacterium]